MHLKKEKNPRLQDAIGLLLFHILALTFFFPAMWSLFTLEMVMRRMERRMRMMVRIRGCCCEPSDDAVRFGGEKPTPSTHTQWCAGVPSPHVKPSRAHEHINAIVSGMAWRISAPKTALISTAFLQFCTGWCAFCALYHFFLHIEAIRLMIALCVKLFKNTESQWIHTIYVCHRTHARTKHFYLFTNRLYTSVNINIKMCARKTHTCEHTWLLLPCQPLDIFSVLFAASRSAMKKRELFSHTVRCRHHSCHSSKICVWK